MKWKKHKEGIVNEETLKELGFEKAAHKVKTRKDMKRKMAIAYEHYRFVSPDVFERFQNEIHNKTKKIDVVCRKCKNKGSVFNPKSSCNWCRGTGAESYTHDELIFIKLKDYPDVPPPDCLMDLQKAKQFNCFDSFEIAKVETIEVRPDPIIFGCINNCVDKFFITQWDDDVKIEDILRDGEG